MSNIDRAGHLMGDYEAANDLDREGLLTPEPQIIRTPAELEALDPDTALINRAENFLLARELIDCGRVYRAEWLPAVKITEGAHYRACREALEGETT